MHELVSLSDDPVYRVRKEIALNMINISKTISHEKFMDKLFPVYKKYSILKCYYL